MKTGFSLFFFSILASVFVMGGADAAVQTINASSSGGGSISGNAVVTKSSVVTCTAASGGQYGTSCYVTAPGWAGLVAVGKSIGTSGAGSVSLVCNGMYPAVGGRLACSANIDDVLCSPEQTITASSSGGGSSWGYAPIKGSAIVQCVYANGGGAAVPSKCNINAPGYSGEIGPTQTIAANGAGTVSLNCTGIYSANGGGLNCGAQISQVCP